MKSRTKGRLFKRGLCWIELVLAPPAAAAPSATPPSSLLHLRRRQTDLTGYCLRSCARNWVAMNFLHCNLCLATWVLGCSLHSISTTLRSTSRARKNGTLQLSPHFPTTRKNPFPKHVFFSLREKGQNRLGAFCSTCSLGLQVSIRASITNRMLPESSRRPPYTTIEYRIRYNEVSSGHSAITALQLIKFQVCPCGQPSRRGPPVANTKTASSRFQIVHWAPVAENRLPTMAGQAMESGSDYDDCSPSQYRKARLMHDSSSGVEESDRESDNGVESEGSVISSDGPPSLA